MEQPTQDYNSRPSIYIQMQACGIYWYFLSADDAKQKQILGKESSLGCTSQ